MGSQHWRGSFQGVPFLQTLSRPAFSALSAVRFCLFWVLKCSVLYVLCVALPLDDERRGEREEICFYMLICLAPHYSILYKAIDNILTTAPPLHFNPLESSPRPTSHHTTPPKLRIIRTSSLPYSTPLHPIPSHSTSSHPIESHPILCHSVVSSLEDRLQDMMIHSWVPADSEKSTWNLILIECTTLNK